MDAAAEPPRIVFEGRELCANADRVQSRLDDTLLGARAPGPAWSVTMHVERDPRLQTLRAAGDVANDQGIRVAHRVLSGPAGDCDAFAQALGVWAALVLDREREHAVAAPARASHASAATKAGVSIPGATPTDASLVGDVASVSLSDVAPDRSALEPAGAAAAGKGEPAPGSEPAVPSPRAPAATLEFGLTTFLTTGIGPNSILGGSPYAVIETSPGFFLRPSLAMGEGVRSEGVSVDLYGARLDGCARVAGNYMQNRGLEVDLCGGTDFTLTAVRVQDGSGPTVLVPELSVGPSLDLGGEIGAGLWVVIRAAGGLNLLRQRVVDDGRTFDAGWLGGRLELALAWRLR